MENIYNCIKDLFIPGAAIIISIFSLSYSLIYSKKSLENSILSDLLENYRSEKMGIYIKRLWDYYHACKGEDENKYEINLQNKYKNDYKLLKNSQNNKEDHIHYIRRYVSQYFLLVSIYYKNRHLPIKIIKQIWTSDDLLILEKIIIPIDIIIPELFGNKRIDKKIELIKIFYNDLKK